MAASAEKSREAEAKWGRQVALQKESGLSAKEYCRQNGLDARYFSLWRRRFRERTARTEGFIRITPQQENERVKIETPKGYRIEVGAKFDETLLRRLIAVLS